MIKPKDKKLFKQFDDRWQKVRALEKSKKERLSLEEKLSKLLILMRLGKALRPDFKGDSLKTTVRSRWIQLKKSFHGKNFRT